MESGAQPGNENAAKGREWTQAIKRALARRGEGDYRRGLDLLADKLVRAAETDESAWQKAIEAIGDRVEGKPRQIAELSGPDGGAIPHSVTVSLVRPERTAT